MRIGIAKCRFLLAEIHPRSALELTWAEGEEVMQPVDVVGTVGDWGDEVPIRHPPVQAVL